jgi:hypothetical protein
MTNALESFVVYRSLSASSVSLNDFGKYKNLRLWSTIDIRGHIKLAYSQVDAYMPRTSVRGS